MKKLFVLSVGGSLLVPDDVDSKYIRKLSRFIRRWVKRKARFVIVTGGGKTARRYINAAGHITHIPGEDRDWLGIHATRLNAHLLRTALRDIACPRVVKDPNKPSKTDKPVLIGAGWKPGFSTDYDAVVLARKLGAAAVYNLTDTDYVYDKDPKLTGAKRLPKLTWKEYRKIVPEWKPGLNAPFDPIASKLAQKGGLRVFVLNGRDLPNLDRAMRGRTFKGTLISPP